MKRFLLMLAIVLAVVVVLVLALGLYLYRRGATLHQRQVVVKPPAVELVGDPLRGGHLAASRGCLDCHAGDLGGRVVIDAPSFGRIPAPNLTGGDGGLPADYDLQAWDRAIRHGVGGDGHPLFLMPSHDYWYFSDQELADLVAWCRSQPPVDRDPGPVELGPVARMLLATGGLELAYDVIDHGAVRPAVPAKAAEAAYGRHLARIACMGCHGSDLAGGPIPAGDPAWPPAADLRPAALAGWSQAQFTAALRTGKRPDGTLLDEAMPRSFAALDEVELAALWAFLQAPGGG